MARGAIARQRSQGALGSQLAPVAVEDLRQVVPWVLFDRLKINPQSQFFQKLENKVLLTDRVSWVRQLFDRAVQQRLPPAGDGARGVCRHQP